MDTGAQPIAFRVAGSNESPHDSSRQSDGWLTRSRALSGMQKEALVENESGDVRWRFLCDEGPWLNGTDLAPFPLGYFAAGLVSCLLAEASGVAANSGPRPAESDLSMRLDIHFSMEGSILRGSMTAGVDSIRLSARCSAMAIAQLDALVQDTLRRSALSQAIAAYLPSRFRLVVNQSDVPWQGEYAESLRSAKDPAPSLEQLEPAQPGGDTEVLVRKIQSGPAAGSSPAVGLQGEQKRQVHIAAEAHTRSDGLQEIDACCVHPAGSRFRFLASGSPIDYRAPQGEAYLSAGIAFCFMTQLGRYAQIKKLPLKDYRLVQYSRFAPHEPAPVETAVFLYSEDSAESNLKMVQMGEQTCYVHTTLREPQAIQSSFTDAGAGLSGA